MCLRFSTFVQSSFKKYNQLCDFKQPISLDNCKNVCTLSYYQHQIGNMNPKPLFSISSFNNGMRYMFCYAPNDIKIYYARAQYHQGNTQLVWVIKNSPCLNLREQEFVRSLPSCWRMAVNSDVSVWISANCITLWSSPLLSTHEVTYFVLMESFAEFRDSPLTVHKIKIYLCFHSWPSAMVKLHRRWNYYMDG